ncbi:MAG: DUF2029 domain-containing protein [bacterium]|nr:DUF2029 domain-containing protein [bacterium]
MQGVWESYSRIGIDFQYYYEFEKNIGRSDIWFVYPPFFWLLMIPWRLIPYPVAKNIWVSLNLIVLIFISWFSFQWIHSSKGGQQSVDNGQRRYGYNGTLYTAGFVFICIYYFYPLIVTLQTGQVNLMLLAILLVCLWLYIIGKKTVAAILLGIAVAIKWLPALLLVYFLLKKEKKFVVISTITIIILWLLPLPIFGLEKISRYFTATQHLATRVFSDYLFLNNTSLLAFWCDTSTRLSLPIWFGQGFYYSSIFIIISIWLYMTWQRRSHRETGRLIFEFVWTIATATFLLPFIELHHFTLTLPLYLVGLTLSVVNRSYIAFSILIISWILVNLGFQLGDVTTIGQSSYLYRYLSLFGVLIGWVAGLIIQVSIKDKIW